eukprot:4329453-Prymnesium_polylepis.1
MAAVRSSHQAIKPSSHQSGPRAPPTTAWRRSGPWGRSCQKRQSCTEAPAAKGCNHAGMKSIIGRQSLTINHRSSIIGNQLQYLPAYREASAAAIKPSSHQAINPLTSRRTFGESPSMKQSIHQVIKPLSHQALKQSTHSSQRTFGESPSISSATVGSDAAGRFANRFKPCRGLLHSGGPN